MPTNQYVLVVGGAGYIGSHMVRCLQSAGLTPLVLDNLSTGHQDSIGNAEFILGNMGDVHLLDKLFSQYPVSAVMHFGSYIEVNASVKQPEKYYQNNVAATLNLLQALIKNKIKYFIFSSSAAVYGEPQYSPIDENHIVKPISPYGHNKAMVEQILKDFSNAYDFEFVALRYFNAAGADPKGDLRERHEPESHLIPLVLQAASGKRKSITVYGRDYPTPDGTCLRDYIHVNDLCSAHLAALQSLFSGNKNRIYNLGTGQGYSVQQVIDVVKAVTQKNILVEAGSRRLGDPAILVANPQLAMQELNWQPKYSDLETIIRHAWKAAGKENFSPKNIYNYIFSE